MKEGKETSGRRVGGWRGQFHLIELNSNKVCGESDAAFAELREGKK